MGKRVFFIFFLLIFLCISYTSVSVSALDYGCPVETVSGSVLLVNMDTNTVVYEKNADQKRFPASTTKIMTYIVVLEAVNDIDNTRVEVKESVLNVLKDTGSSLSGLEYHVGDKMTVKDLLYCLMVSSGNDAAVVLADYVGNGDTQKFVDKMNTKAAELGCKNTHFTNPHGLHDDNHYTTANDLYTMSSYALTLPYFSEISNTSTYYCEGDTYPLVTTNYMIDQGRGGEYYYVYARGIKTGTTDEAGRCLVSTAIADGYAYMCIVLNAPYEPDGEIGSMIDSKELYRWALLNLELQTVVTKETPVCEQKINFAWDTESILLVPEEDINSIVPKELGDADITVDYNILDSVDTPIKKGQIIGTAKVYYKGQELKEINLVANQSVERSPVLYVMHVIKTIVFSPWFLIALAIVIILFITYLVIASRNTKKNSDGKNVKRYRNL